MQKSLLLVLSFIFSLCYSQTYKDDSLIVKAVLDSGGVGDNYSVKDVTDSSGGRITTLWCKYTVLVHLPPTIGNLTALKRLDLFQNLLVDLPSGIGNLSNLKTLILSKNRLPILPSTIGQLGKLDSLDLDENRLTALPPDMMKLVNLKMLNVNNNRLCALPDTMKKWLEVRSSGWEYYQTCPFDPGDSLAVRAILDANGLDTVKVGSVCSNTLGRITSLGLDKKGITLLPPQIGLLTKLTGLSLNGNHLTTLPKEISNCTDLQFLLVSRNNLAELPNEIGRLTRLRGLDISSNRLTSLPDSIVNLHNLYVCPSTNCITFESVGLFLDGNQLCSLPKEIEAWVVKNYFFAPDSATWKTHQNCTNTLNPAVKTPGEPAFALSVRMESRKQIDFCVALQSPGLFSVAVYNIAGRMIWHCQMRNASLGYHTVRWRPDAELRSGIYLVFLKSGSKEISSTFQYIK
jgi:Leucine-rich repeat (LRR) protein